jgi:hypothetical protein
MVLQALFACAEIRAAFDAALQAIVDGKFWDREVIPCARRTGHSVGFAEIELRHEVEIWSAIAWVDKVVKLLQMPCNAWSRDGVMADRADDDAILRGVME